MPKALIAMSGGVDSSVAAYLMRQAGYDCVGAMMRLFDGDDAGRESSCCSLEDAEDARAVAFRLGIPFNVFNFTGDFKAQVIDRFIDAYERGLTPNPCIDCNRFLKFERLFRRANELGCDYIVTGHYARIEQSGDRYLLKKALDVSKDQSYVLYAMTQEQLAHTKFPLGETEKTETRRIAQEQGFCNARKKDSQDICFVPDGDYAKVIEDYTGKRYAPGRFVDRNGKTLGEHGGLIRYTVGQRKGLGISASEPLYVCEKRTKENEVVLGPNEALYQKAFEVGDFNWIAFENPPDKTRAKVRIRYHQHEQWATVLSTGDRNVHIEFDEPQRAVAPGQAAVVYDGDIVLGGGIISADKEE